MKKPPQAESGAGRRNKNSNIYTTDFVAAILFIVATVKSPVFFDDECDEGNRDYHHPHQDIKIDHSISDWIHCIYDIYERISDTLSTQRSVANNNPVATISQFISPLRSRGSINTDAKTTWAISRAIAESVFSRAGFSAIYRHHKLSKYNVKSDSTRNFISKKAAAGAGALWAANLFGSD